LYKISWFLFSKTVSYKPSDKPANCLNSNHNSFILVHSATESEIKLRAALEAQIKEKLKIPMVLIVLEGGFGTMGSSLHQII
jgi:hypothetical protein